MTDTQQSIAPRGAAARHAGMRDDDWAEWIRRRWPDVRIVQLGSAPGRGAAPSATITARACVHLGALTPADVRVEVVGREGSHVADAAPTPPCRRLWSVRSYANGSFLFEGEVPRAMLEHPAGVDVRVRADPQRGHTALAPVARPFPVPDRQGRAPGRDLGRPTPREIVRVAGPPPAPTSLRQALPGLG